MLYYNNVENAEILKNIIVDFDIPEQWKIFDCVFTFSVCYHQSTKEYNKFDYNIVESYNLGLLNVNNGVYSEIIIKREEGDYGDGTYFGGGRIDSYSLKYTSNIFNEVISVQLVILKKMIGWTFVNK